MAETITIKADDGGSFSAYVVKPAKLPAPAIICIQEIFGINYVMRDIAAYWADKGFIAIAPDLFWRQEPGVDITDKSEEEWNKAFALFKGFDVDKGIQDLKTTLEHVRKMDGCTGKVGTIGFCLGGKLAYLMATRSSAECNVGYYGVSIDENLDEASSITAPLVLHIAEEDGFVSKDAQAKIKEGLAGNDHVIMYSYPGMDHGFARVGGKPYDEENTILANGRSEEALKRALL